MSQLLLIYLCMYYSVHMHTFKPLAYIKADTHTNRHRRKQTHTYMYIYKKI